MAFVPPVTFATIPWAQREGTDQTDRDAPLLPIGPGEMDAETTARRRRWYQLSNAPGWDVLLTLIGQGQAHLEAAIGSVDQGRWLVNAEGTVLDEIGALVNRPRVGLSDALYRLAIRSEAASLLSSGTIPEILELTRSLLGDEVRVRELWPATIVISAPDVASDVFLVLLDILADVPAAGVGALLSTWDSATTGGWGSTTDPGGTEVTAPGTFSSTTGTDADAGLALWSTGQPIGGE
jgi:hypothetical protein